METVRILMNKYELGKKLGEGNFAKVYYAKNIKTDQAVAIKVINKEKVLKCGLDLQTKREITTMGKLRHSNILQVYEAMANRSKIYLVLEYAKGGELYAKVVNGRLKEDIGRWVFQQLISAVDFCHTRGVYHRDLKLENLLLDESALAAQPNGQKMDYKEDGLHVDIKLTTKHVLSKDLQGCINNILGRYRRMEYIMSDDHVDFCDIGLLPWVVHQLSRVI